MILSPQRIQNSQLKGGEAVRILDNVVELCVEKQNATTNKKLNPQLAFH